jgi:hypothetical protein
MVEYESIDIEVIQVESKKLFHCDGCTFYNKKLDDCFCLTKDITNTCADGLHIWKEVK